MTRHWRWVVAFLVGLALGWHLGTVLKGPQEEEDPEEQIINA